MKHLISTLSGVLVLPFLCHAQTEYTDSVGIVTGLEADSAKLMTAPSVFSKGDTIPAYYSMAYRYESLPEPMFSHSMSQPFELKVPELSFAPGQGTVYSWPSGEVVATIGTTVYPGLMRIESGSLGINQQVGNFTLYGGGIANKYGYFQGLHTQYGVNGSISYQFNPKVSVTAFGTYYFGNPPVLGPGLPMLPAMIGYYGVSKFGGYVDYDAGERVGVMVGGQAVQQVGTQKYEAEPIVTPYIKLGNGKRKFSIGLPVGQILHGLMRR